MENKSYIVFLKYFENLVEKTEPLYVTTFAPTKANINNQNTTLKLCYEVLMNRVIDESIDPHLDHSLCETTEYIEMKRILSTNGALVSKSVDDFLTRYNSPSLFVQMITDRGDFG